MFIIAQENNSWNNIPERISHLSDTYPAKVSLIQTIDNLWTWRKETPPQRAVCNNSNTKFSECFDQDKHNQHQNRLDSNTLSQDQLTDRSLPTSRNNLFFSIPSPQRPFQLNSSNWVNCMGSPNCWGTNLRQTNVLYLPFLIKFLKLSHLACIIKLWSQRLSNNWRTWFNHANPVEKIFQASRDSKHWGKKKLHVCSSIVISIRTSSITDQSSTRN